MSNPSKFHAYSGFFLGLHDNPQKAQTHYMLVVVQWAPDERRFHELRLRAQPMSNMNLSVEVVRHCERAQREGQVLIQFGVTNSSIEISAAWSLSRAWEREKSLKLERQLERKCVAAGPSAGDTFYKCLRDKGHSRTEAQEILGKVGLHRTCLKKERSYT